jgi:hypothetical protein
MPFQQATQWRGPITATTTSIWVAKALLASGVRPQSAVQIVKIFPPIFCESCYDLQSVSRAAQMNASSEMNRTEMLAIRLDMLRREHRDLDIAIELEMAAPLPDRLTLQRMKKQKLLLKDQITTILTQLIPNIIA